MGSAAAARGGQAVRLCQTRVRSMCDVVRVRGGLRPAGPGAQLYGTPTRESRRAARCPLVRRGRRSSWSRSWRRTGRSQNVLSRGSRAHDDDRSVEIVTPVPGARLPRGSFYSGVYTIASSSIHFSFASIHDTDRCLSISTGLQYSSHARASDFGLRRAYTVSHACAAWCRNEREGCSGV